MKNLFLAIAILLSTLSVRATHVMGTDMSYRFIGNGKYEITVKVYRDCNGIQLSQSNVILRCGSNTVTVSNQTKVSVQDITGAVGCPNGSRCAGNYMYGIEEHVWTMEVDLSSYSCCEWEMSWSQCCRNGAITTGSANQNFFSTATLNKCVTPENSSPTFSNKPIRMLCVGQDVVYSMAAIDTIDSGDSLSYALTEPLQNYGQQTTYAGMFNQDRPLSFLGFPNQNQNYPGGFHLNPVSGELRFRPTQVNQVAVIVVEVTEWRKVNGYMQVIGKTRRDMQVIVTNCNNQNPTVQGPNAIFVCPGDSVSISYTSDDPDSGDTTTLRYSEGIPGSVFHHNNGQAEHASGSFHWRTSAADKRANPYVVHVTTTDDGCPFNLESTKSTYIFVYDSNAQVGFQAGPDKYLGLGDTSIQTQGYDYNMTLQAAYWTTEGDGYFDDSLATSPKYYLGQNDRIKCSIQLIRHAMSFGNCLNLEPDTMNVYTSLGDFSVDSIGTVTRNYVDLEATGQGQVMHYWSTSGDGYFVDSSTSNTRYYFGTQDRDSCTIKLSWNRLVDACAPSRIEVPISIPFYFDAGPDQQLAVTESSVNLNGVDSFVQGQYAIWETLGDGYFNDSSIAQPTYSLGQQDLIDCSIALVRQPKGAPNCANLEPDTVWVSRSAGTLDIQQTQVHGTDSISLIGVGTNPYATYYWTSDGDGHFKDSTDKSTTYYFGTQDQSACQVMIRWNYDAASSCQVNPDLEVINLNGNFDLTAQMSQTQDSVILNVASSSSQLLTWNTNGSGTWDVDTANQSAVYMLSTADKADTTLSFWVYQNSTCGMLYDSLVVNYSFTTGLQRLSTATLRVYPNPALDRLNIETDAAIDRVVLMDIQGRALKSARTTTLDISYLAPGTYLLRVEFEDGSIGIKKWQKQ